MAHYKQYANSKSKCSKLFHFGHQIAPQPSFAKAGRGNYSDGIIGEQV